MQVCARDVDLKDCPRGAARFATPGQVFVKPGHRYEVAALAVFEGQPLLQLVDDIQYPAWLPAWLFDVVDPVLPPDWICNVFNAEPSVIMGPDFVARDPSAYARMVQLEPDEVALFWKRIKALSNEPRAGG